MRHIYFTDENNVADSNGKCPVKRALLINSDEWSKLNDHLTREQKLFEATEEKLQKDEAMRSQSKEMSKTWDNTVLNLRKKRFDQRKAKLERLEAHRKRRYLEARREEEDLKKKINSDAKDILRLEKDGLKTLTSSLRFAEMLREREKQIDFNAKLREIEEEREEKYVQQILKDVEDYKKEQTKLKELEMKRKKKLTLEAQEQFRKALEEKNKNTTERIKQENEDNINIIREIKQEEENARKELQIKRKIIMDDVISNRKMIEEFAKQKQLEDEEEDNAVKIHAAAKKKIALIRKLKEQELRDEVQVRRNKITSLVTAVVADKSAKEDAMIRKAVAEKDALEEKDKQNKKEYQERLVKELKDNRKEYLKLEEQRKVKEKEEFKWNLMQRLKLTEENETFYLEKKIEADNIREELKEMWNKQTEERALEKAREEAETVLRHTTQWDDDDEEFLEYGKLLLEDSKKKGRPLFPIERRIEEYKKAHNLGKQRVQHNIWKSNVPIDSCPSLKKKAVTKKIEDTSPIVKHNSESRAVASVGKAKESVRPWPSEKETKTRVSKLANGLL